MNKKYYWKLLLDGGVLKEPPGIGPYYNEVEFNNYNGFDTEDEAILYAKEIVKYLKRIPYYNLVLISIYKFDLDDSLIGIEND